MSVAARLVARAAGARGGCARRIAPCRSQSGHTRLTVGPFPPYACCRAAEGATLALLLLFGAARVAGGTSKAFRQTAETLDTFVGRYLLLTTVAYIGIKLVHFKVFPDLF